MKRILPFLTVFLLLPCMVSATDYYIDASGGSDTTGDGSASAPFATPQKGLELAIPGDSVVVRPGVYYVGGLMMPRSGEPGNPIVFEGEDGAVLDGGILATSWVPAPEIGDGVYKTIIDVPYLLKGTYRDSNRAMTMTYDDKFILHINDQNQNKIDYGFGLMRNSSDSALWNGIVAVHGRRYKNDPYTFLRFGDKRNPNDGVVRVGNHWEYDDSGTVNILGKSHIIVRGFTIKNRAIGVNIRNGASDNIIENNTILGGRYTVFIGYFSTQYPDAGEEVLCHRNQIRNNEITWNYIYPLELRNLDTATKNNIWKSVKEYFGDTDHIAVAMLNAGHDNQVYGNHIYAHWDGIQDWGTDYTVFPNDGQYSQRLKVYNNTVHDMLDDGLEPTGGEIDAEWHDNHVYDSNVNLRIKQPEYGPLYVYGNTFSGPRWDIFYFGGCTSEIYVYHNSMSSERGMSMGNSSSYLGAPNTWFVNNIFSNLYFWTNGSYDWDEHMNAHFDYNWAGGKYDLQGASWPNPLPEWMGSHNIIEPDERLWGDSADPSFLLAEDSPAREAGINLSQQWIMDGVTNDALPGMDPGYFSGANPDLGAVQHGGCVEDWSCTTWSEWSGCLSNQQSRTMTCTDDNSCGTENSKPDETETRLCGGSEDLVCNWTMDSGDVSGNTVLDGSGNGNDGTMHGNPQVVSGRVGDALSIDGNDYINMSDSLSMDFDKSQGTIMMWIKPDNPATGNRQLLVIDSDFETEFNMQGDGDLYFYPWFDWGNNQNYNLVTNPLLAGEWQHITVAWNYSTKTASIYVNGAEQALAIEQVPTHWTAIALTSDWHIGGSPVKDEYFSGLIDELKIYNRSLSSQDILDMYDSAFHRADTSPKDGCVEDHELIPFIDLWKYDSTANPMSEMMEAVVLYYNPGAWCS